MATDLVQIVIGWAKNPSIAKGRYGSPKPTTTTANVKLRYVKTNKREACPSFDVSLTRQSGVLRLRSTLCQSIDGVTLKDVKKILESEGPIWIPVPEVEGLQIQRKQLVSALKVLGVTYTQ